MCGLQLAGGVGGSSGGGGRGGGVGIRKGGGSYGKNHQWTN